MAEKEIEIIVGTNEEYILGYRLRTDENGTLSLEQSFADHSHTGSVRQVATGGKYLVSGGTDEHIKVFDLKKHVAVGTLMEHEGTITYLGFHGNRYLFSAAEDGKICIFSKKEWQCEKTLRGHKSSVLSVSVHPSGKLALSLSQDKKLRTWNLIKGRKAYITHMDRVADFVQWTPSGASYIIVKGSCVEVYDVASCKLVHTVDFKERVTVVTFITEDIIAVAAGDRNICFYDITNHFEILQWEAHSLRVKSLQLIPRADAEEPWLVSASSDGIIRVWKLQMLSLTTKPEMLTEIDTTCRIICMTIYMENLSKKDEIENIVKKEKSNLKENYGLEDGLKSGTKKKIKKKKVKKVPSDNTDTKESVCLEAKIENVTKKKTKKKKAKILASEDIAPEGETENGTEENEGSKENIVQEVKTKNGTNVKKKKKKNKAKILTSEGVAPGETENGTEENEGSKENIVQEVKTENGTNVKKKKKKNKGVLSIDTSPKKKMKLTENHDSGPKKKKVKING